MWQHYNWLHSVGKGGLKKRRSRSRKKALLLLKSFVCFVFNPFLFFYADQGVCARNAGEKNRRSCGRLSSNADHRGPSSLLYICCTHPGYAEPGTNTHERFPLWYFGYIWNIHALRLSIVLRCSIVWMRWEIFSAWSSRGGNIPLSPTCAMRQTSSWTADMIFDPLTSQCLNWAIISTQWIHQTAGEEPNIWQLFGFFFWFLCVLNHNVGLCIRSFLKDKCFELLKCRFFMNICTGICEMNARASFGLV